MMGTTAFYPDKNITSKVIDFSVVKATPEIADKLKIKETSFVYKIHRVRIVDDKPTVIEETYMQHAYLNESRRGGIPRYAVRAVVSSSYHESGNLQYVFEHV